MHLLPRRPLRSFLLPLAFLLADDVAFAQSAPPPDTSLSELDVARIAEFYRMCDVLEEDLFPGFDPRAIPLAINHEERCEMLIAHPSPPEEYHPHETLRLEGEPVMVREGAHRPSLAGNSWIAGVQVAAFGSLREGRTMWRIGIRSTEQLLALKLHEAFHIYQFTHPRLRPSGRREEVPDLDAEYSAMLRLESAIVRAILDEPDDDAAAELGFMFVAVRAARRAPLTKGQITHENESEHLEGIASYLEARLFQLLDDGGGLPPTEEPLADPLYHHFASVGADRQRMLDRVLPSPGTPAGLIHLEYNLGLGLCLVLDRFHPDWKVEIMKPRVSQSILMEQAFPEAAGDEFLVEMAKERFDYAAKLELETKLMEKQLDLVRGFLEAPGRRYVIDYAAMEGRLRIKSQGGYTAVPACLREEFPWADSISDRGYEVLGMGEFDFTSKFVPVIFQHGRLEWRDPDPASDFADLKIESSSSDGDLHHDVTITTDGFTMTAPRAELTRTDDMVTIRVLPRE